MPVRAQHDDGSFSSVDIAELDAPSLLAFIRSRGGGNEYAESLVFHLLGWSPDDFHRAQVAAKPADLFVIECKPHHRSGRGRWWRDAGAGYTSLLEDIGLYKRGDHRLNVNPDDNTVRPLADVLRELDAPAAQLLARVRSLEASNA